MKVCNTGCVQKPMSEWFYKLGRLIARKPILFILFPIIISVGFSFGLFRMKKTQDIEYLFTPTNGRGKTERKLISKHFPIDYADNFHPLRFQKLKGFATIIITAKDDANILRSEILEAAKKLYNDIKNFKVKTSQGIKMFSDLCARWMDSCIENPLFALIEQKNTTDIKITYPISHRFYYMGTTLGKVKLKPNTSEVQEAEALKLVYYLKISSDENHINNTLSLEWLHKFLVKMKDFKSDKISVSYKNTDSIETELEQSIKEVIPFFSITYIILISFTVITSSTADWVLSKPWLAFSGVFSAGLAIGSAIGLLCAFEYTFISSVGFMPFLILGIGIDDTFILLATWRITSRKDSVEERTGKTFELAGISITLTSLTNVIAFGVGAITHFPSIQIFCLYTSLATAFSYFYAVSFFGACLALTGRREHENRHCCTFKKTQPISQADGKSSMFQIFCMGGYDENQDEQEHGGQRFFRLYFAPFILSNLGRLIFTIIYLGYLSVTIYGCINLKQGLEIRNLANDGSYLIKFYDERKKYFSSYGLILSVAVTEELDYSKQSVQNQIEDLTKKFEDSTYVIKGYTDSWLRQFLSIKKPTQSNFMKKLKSFLNLRQFKKYNLDLEIGKKSKKIKASRFLIQTKYVQFSDNGNFMIAMRKIADESELNVVVFHPAFVYFDQFIVILDNAYQNIGIAIFAMFLISLILIPNFLCSLWVVFSIVSIDAGVVGFMTLWGLSLDAVSMISIIVCIGFSVDFSSHIAYSYVKSDFVTKKSKALASLSELGFPLTQNAMSSILGIIILGFSSSYIFRTFFKTMFLVILFGAYHGLIVLPVMLSFLGPG